jgi:hypothetical protein
MRPLDTGNGGELAVSADTKSTLGRPRLPRSKARNKRIVTFVTEHELVELKAIAGKDFASLSYTMYRLLKLGIRETSEIGKDNHE